MGIALVAPLFALSQKTTQSIFDRIEPPNWWIGMKNTELQILLYKHDAAIGDYDASLNYAGVEIKEKIRVENPH